MKQFKALLVLPLLLFSCGSFAWGKTGHRVTGAIAEHYLSAQSKQQIKLLLPSESLAEASTYADEMRSNPDKFWQHQASAYHYVTVPKGQSYSRDHAPEQGDAVTALTEFRATLLNPASSYADKQLALRFIVHIIADLHQPLHAGNGTDRGGNDKKVRFFWQDSNLHRVWDSGMIDRQQLSFTEWADWLNSKISKRQRHEWRDVRPYSWIAESTKIRDKIYPLDHELSWDYQYQHLPTVKLRLQQAGVRIAAYLNALFAEQQQTGDK